MGHYYSFFNYSLYTIMMTRVLLNIFINFHIISHRDDYSFYVIYYELRKYIYLLVTQVHGQSEKFTYLVPLYYTQPAESNCNVKSQKNPSGQGGHPEDPAPPLEKVPKLHGKTVAFPGQ